MEAIITILVLLILICTLILLGHKWSREYKEKQILINNKQFKPFIKTPKK